MQFCELCGSYLRIREEFFNNKRQILLVCIKTNCNTKLITDNKTYYRYKILTK